MPALPAEAPLTQCRLATTAAELSVHFAIRWAVFVAEQQMFEVSDRDEHDLDPAAHHVLAWHGQVAAGGVRLYPTGYPGIWKGDRLAVLPPCRSRGIGAPLVRFAVATAAALGGHRMVAHIQPLNVGFFRRLGWYEIGGLVGYADHPHQLMTIGLSR